MEDVNIKSSLYVFDTAAQTIFIEVENPTKIEFIDKVKNIKNDFLYAESKISKKE